MSCKRLADACFQAGKYVGEINHIYTVEEPKNGPVQDSEDDLLLDNSSMFFKFSVAENMKKLLEVDQNQYYKEHLVLGVIYHVGK